MPQAENDDLQRRTGGIFAVAVAVREPVRTLDVARRDPGMAWGHRW